MSRRNLVSTLSAALVLGLAATAPGCGDSGETDKTAATQETQQTTTETTEKTRKPVPRSLNTVESGAEDTIDFARAGNREKVVSSARKLQRAAAGPAAADLREAGVPADTITALQDRARLVSSLSRRSGFLRLSLGANQVSALMPELFGYYSDPVPPDVLKLDYLDREAQLRSQARDEASVGAAVTDLASTWTGLRPDVIEAGGAKVAARFTRHVAAMQRLAPGTDTAALQKEAARGLELVDRLEDAFRGK